MVEENKIDEYKKTMDEIVDELLRRGKDTEYITHVLKNYVNSIVPKKTFTIEEKRELKKYLVHLVRTKLTALVPYTKQLPSTEVLMSTEVTIDENFKNALRQSINELRRKAQEYIADIEKMTRAVEEERLRARKRNKGDFLSTLKMAGRRLFSSFRVSTTPIKELSEEIKSAIRDKLYKDATDIAVDQAKTKKLSAKQRNFLIDLLKQEVDAIIAEVVYSTAKKYEGSITKRYEGKFGRRDTGWWKVPRMVVYEVMGFIITKLFPLVPYILAVLLIIIEFAFIRNYTTISTLSVLSFIIFYIIIFIIIDILRTRSSFGFAGSFGSAKKGMVASRLLTTAASLKSGARMLDFVWLLQVILAGLLAAGGTMILLGSVGVEILTEGWGWIGLFVLIYILVYAASQFTGVLSITVIVLFIGYIFAGPYGPQMRYYVRQIKEPLETFWNTVNEGLRNVWLMLTNPTAWYYEQQQRNAHPERPIDFPKGVEIISYEAMPPTVPKDMSRPFRVFVQIQNKGYMTATNVSIQAMCKKRCLVAGNKTSEQTEDMAPRAGDTVILGPFLPNGKERQYSRLNIYSKYDYSTNATLPVEVMSPEEIKRRFEDLEFIFKGVSATFKDGPVMLSLNVGKQPLEAGQKNWGLLVSISNRRNDGNIFLVQDKTKIILHVPRELTQSGYRCDSPGIDCRDIGEETKECVITQNLVVKPIDSKTIFSFFCEFDITEDVGEKNISKSFLILAELVNYTYRVEKELNVPITLPLALRGEESGLGGYEVACGRCGKGKLNKCDRNECHELGAAWPKKGESNCYFETKRINECKPCKGGNCEYYDNDEECELDPCGFEYCRWEKSLGGLMGKCISLLGEKKEKEEFEVLELTSSDTKETATEKVARAIYECYFENNIKDTNANCYKVNAINYNGDKIRESDVEPVIEQWKDGEKVTGKGTTRVDRLEWNKDILAGTSNVCIKFDTVFFNEVEVFEC